MTRITAQEIRSHKQTGYTRPIVEEDVWFLNDSRQAETIAKDLELKFYARCPAPQRPLHLGGSKRKSQSQPGCEATSCLSKSDEYPCKPAPLVVSCEGTNNRIHSDMSPPQEQDTMYPRALIRTASLVERVATRDTRSSGLNTAGKTEEAALKEATTATSVSDIRHPGVITVLRWLSPIVNLVKGSKLEPRNLTCEVPEEGRRRYYDCSLLKALIHACWKRHLLSIALAASGSVLATTSSIVTKRLVAFIADSHAWGNARDGETQPPTLWHGFGLAIGLALMRESTSIVNNHSFFQSMTCGMYQPYNVLIPNSVCDIM